MIDSDQRKRLDNLSSAKRALLVETMRRKAALTQHSQTIPRRSQDDLVPLSYAQQRLWFLHQFQPDSPAYNVGIPLHFEGPLDLSALRRALSEVVRRHEVLRTTFPTAGGLPVQKIGPAIQVALPIVELSALAIDDRQAETRRLAMAEANGPFDLERGPLLRVLLLRLAPEIHDALFTVHHIISDEWSTMVFTREVTELYGSFLRHEPSPLAELALQYADFAVWQRRQLQGEVLVRLLTYWRRQLADLKTLDLPTDHPRPALQSFRGERRAFAVSESLTQSLRELSRQQGVTLFMTLLAVYQMMLHRLSGQDDVVVGSPVANRNRVEIEPLIGCFVNAMVLRTDFSGAQTFRTVLQRVRQVVLRASDHQDLPFEKLVEELQPERDPSRNPIFQVVIAFQNTQRESMRLPALSLSSMEFENLTAKFDLRLPLVESERGMVGALEHNTDLFDRTTAERWMRYFVRLLELVVSEVETSVSSLVLLSAGERHQLLWEWNDTLEPVGEVSIQDLVEAQVLRTPGALAVVSDEESLSYWELNRRANGLAHHLRSLGVGVGSLVGVYLERSAAMVPVLLGVLKSGGAYVPIDPSYPAARVEWILSSLGVRWVVSDSPRVDGLASVRSLEHVVRVDAGEGEREENPVVGCTAADVAYVIFTSGSTGRPKGVVVRHGAVVNLLGWVSRRFGIGAGDRGLFITSLCFDLSVYDIFGLLSSGGTVRVAGEEAVRDPERLLALLEGEAITFWDSAPAALQQLVPFFTLHGAPSGARLRLVFLSGDWIPVGLPEEVRSRYPGSQVVSFGGATEAAVWSNVYPIGEVQREWRSIPYGRPIGNARYLILDEESELCAIGVPGDLYIGGECLASGYAGEAGLTAERFVPSGFGGAPGERLYRTGDRARFWRDGTMEFLGRRDQQVKVRGFRVELGEIESSLGEHPGVSEAVVSAWQDSSGHKRLVAYVVGREGVSAESAELRRYLSERLPSYMVPSVYVALESLPVTANGKLDRRALPSPEETREDSRSYTAPRNPVEELLADIWAEVLRLDRVGIHDNFFEIGGDSILSIQIVSRARQKGVLLMPRQVFEHQSIAELAAVAGTGEQVESEQGLVQGQVPLTPIQRWFLQDSPVDPHHFNQAVLLEVRRFLAPAVLEKAVARLLRTHDALRLRFSLENGEWRQEITAELDPVPYTLIDLALLPVDRQGRQIESLAAALQISFDLGRGPLLRVVQIDLGSGRPSRLVLVIHHLAVDGVSWRVILGDLERLCLAIGDEKIQLPPKSTSFKRWAELLVEYSVSPALAEEAEFWLTDARRRAGRLPVDHRNGANLAGSTQGSRVALDLEDTRALLQEVPAVYHTEITHVLLTALVETIAKLTGSRLLLVDLEGHGRTDLFQDVDLSRTVGWFTSIYPVLLDLDGIAGAGKALTAVKEQLRKVPHDGFGYGVLRYHQGWPDIARRLRDLPEAEVSFNYLGQLDTALDKASPFGPGAESAGPVQSPWQLQKHLLQVTCRISGGRLWVTFGYSPNLFEPSTVEGLAEGFLAELRSLIRHCQSPEAGGYTPSDFPDVNLDQRKLDKLFDELDLG